uniref:C2H2-type domain-containing protein n=1 Tax=Anopheles epiroticus TaxID=199890 RepID=A0A182PCR9_9DIPT
MAFRTQKKNCGICGEKRPICHPNLLAVKTKFSSTTVAQLLERFAERELSDLGTELEQSGTCKDCYTKLNDYDAAYTKALIIQQELTDLLQNSGLRIFDEEQILAEEVEAENVEMKWEQMEEIEQPDDTNPTKLISIESLQAVQFCMELNVCGEGFGNISDAQWHTHDEESDDEQLDAPVKESGNPSPMLVIEAIEQPEQILVNEGLAACDGTISTTYTEGENDPRCIKTEEHIEESHPIVEGYVCKTHSGERPFACPVCGQLFSQRYNMVQHLNAHNGAPKRSIKVLECPYCDRTCDRKTQLKKHLEKCHPDKPVDP